MDYLPRLIASSCAAQLEPLRRDGLLLAPLPVVLDRQIGMSAEIAFTPRLVASSPRLVAGAAGLSAMSSQ